MTTIPVSNQTDKNEFPFILSQSFNHWSLPIPQPERGTTLEIHLKYEYWDILNERYPREEVLSISPKDNLGQGKAN
jgi:hypothetical protein